MPNSKPNPLAILALVLLAAIILFIGYFAVSQFWASCTGSVCPSLIERILRVVATFIAGMMVLAGIGWWIVFNVIQPMRDRDEADPK